MFLIVAVLAANEDHVIIATVVLYILKQTRVAGT